MQETAPLERVHSPAHHEEAAQEEGEQASDNGRFNLQPGEHFYENQSSQQIEQVLVLDELQEAMRLRSPSP